MMTTRSFFVSFVSAYSNQCELRIWKDNDVATGVLSLVAYNCHNIVSCDNTTTTQSYTYIRYTYIFTSFALSTGPECYKRTGFIGCLQLKTDRISL